MASSTNPNSKRVLITGATGQDGFYLARLLVERGYSVIAGVRDPKSVRAASLSAEIPRLKLVPLDLLDSDSVRSSFRAAQPDQIYHLAGKSHVTASWEAPEETLEINTLGTLHLIEAMREAAPEAHLVFAGSGDCFDHAAAPPTGITPSTPLRSTNPYSVSKSAAMQLIQCYRKQFNLRLSIAVLFNHTSPRRPGYFVERKIIGEAVEVSRGKREKVCVGSLETRRDWSWSEDIVKGLASMGAQREPGDYVLASGVIYTTGDWIRRAFDRLNLSMEKNLEIDPAQLHRGDRPHTCGDISLAREALGWKPETSFDTMVDRLIDAELARS